MDLSHADRRRRGDARGLRAFAVAASSRATAPVQGGYEVSCGDGADDLVREIIRSYQVKWHVDVSGAIRMGDRRLLSEEKTARYLDCHVR